MFEDEVQQRWEGLGEDKRNGYQERLRQMKESAEERQQAHLASKERFYNELVEMASQSTKKAADADAQGDTATAESSSFRIPDHEFAIQESRLVFNWALSSTIMLDKIIHSSVFDKAIRESNLPPGSTIPHFVDSEWMGWEHVVATCRAKPSGQPSEALWTKTGYYKVYPDDTFEPDDPIEMENYAAFSNSFKMTYHLNSGIPIMPRTKAATPHQCMSVS